MLALLTDPFSGAKTFDNFDTLTPDEINEALDLAGFPGLRLILQQLQQAAAVVVVVLPHKTTQNGPQRCCASKSSVWHCSVKTSLSRDLLALDQQRQDELNEINNLVGVSADLIEQLTFNANNIGASEQLEAIEEFVKMQFKLLMN